MPAQSGRLVLRGAEYIAIKPASLTAEALLNQKWGLSAERVCLGPAIKDAPLGRLL